MKKAKKNTSLLSQFGTLFMDHKLLFLSAGVIVLAGIGIYVVSANITKESSSNNQPVVTSPVVSQTVTPSVTPTPTQADAYVITQKKISCAYLGADSTDEYYRLTATGEMGGPVGTVGVAESMQIGVSGQRNKKITLTCGSWKSGAVRQQYSCTRRAGDPATTTYSYTENNLIYEKCPAGQSCVDINQNTYFFNTYVYNPAQVKSIKNARPLPFTGKALNYTAFTCGGRKGYGLRLVD